ncbi:MAG: M56 family metallopeptidase, partial [Planctomycetota bacterium]
MESLSMQLQPLFQWLLRTTLQASLLICLILFFQIVMRSKLGARWHYCLWLLLLIRLAIPWAPQSRLSIFNIIPQSITQQQTEYARQEIVDDTAVSEPTSPNATELKPTSTTVVPQDSPKAITTAAQTHKEAKGRSRTVFSGFADILPLIWLTGALVLAVYVCAGNFHLWRLVTRERPLTDQKILDLLEDCKSEMGIRTILGVVITNKVKSPALFGFVRPRLLLPTGIIEALSLKELRHVFFHELAHLKRHDIYLGYLSSLLQTLHWFNPLIWLAFYRIRTDRELACDALVLAQTHSSESKDYGRTIVNLLERFSRRQQLPAMAGILETKAQLKRRITMIAKFKKNSYQWSPMAAILMIILACICLPDAKRTSASETSDIKPPVMVVRQVWADAADPQFMGAPSPDGKYLSYVDWKTGDLAVHDLTTGKNRLLTNEGRSKGLVSYSVFSPDSKQVAYHWWDYGKKVSELRIVGLDGSGPHIVNQDEETANFPMGWIPDGKHILTLSRMWDKSFKILLVPVTDGPVRVLKTLGKKVRKRRCTLSPDGQYVAYSFLPSDDSPNTDISVVAVDGSHEIPLVKYPADDFVLGWAPDGKRVVFASNRTGSMGVWAIEIADGKTQGTPRLLKPEIGQFYPLGLTQSGSFYYGVYSGGNNVYTATYDPHKGNVAAKPVIAVHRYEGSNWAPDWSPDGRYLACLSVRPGTSPLFLISSVETGEVRELSPDIKTFNLHSLRWAPDGRSLLGAGKTKDVFWGVLKIDIETGEITSIVKGPGIFGPNWATDGKAVFYVCNLKTGGIIRHDLSTGKKRELYSTPGFISALAISPDGRQLAFRDIQDGALKVLPSIGGQPREL